MNMEILIYYVNDSSKFNKRSSLILCGLKRIATVITDSGIEDRHAAMLEAAGVNLIVARMQEMKTDKSSASP